MLREVAEFNKGCFMAGKEFYFREKKRTMDHMDFLYNIVILQLENNGTLLFSDGHVTASKKNREKSYDKPRQNIKK